jgi:uncharacterized membrane protein
MCKKEEVEVSKNKLHFAFCHQLPERSFFWKGKQFFMCARCTGINLGYLALPLFVFGIIRIPFLWTILLILPTYIDGGIQAYFNIESTNSRRFITGLISGVATMSLVSHIGIFIAKQILILIN